MTSAWEAARRAFAVVAFGLLLVATLEIAENQVHIKSGFLHLLVFPVAFLISLVLVHGLGLFERWGF